MKKILLLGWINFGLWYVIILGYQQLNKKELGYYNKYLYLKEKRLFCWQLLQGIILMSLKTLSSKTNESDGDFKKKIKVEISKFLKTEYFNMKLNLTK